jgi:hypothetical protein
MGKRSRRQSNQAASAAPEQSAGSPARQRKERLKQRASAASKQAEKTIQQRPPAPWDPFPLTELAIFCGMVLLIVGAVAGGALGKGLMASGFTLACIGGLDTALREHFNGYRSHAGLLAGILALVCLIVVTAVGNVNIAVRAAVAIGVFAVFFPALRRGFVRKSGGRGVL